MKSNSPKLLVRIAKVVGMLVIIGIFYFVLRGQDWSVLQSLNWQSLMIAWALVMLAYVFSGVQYYASLRIIGCKLSMFDIFFFPYMQSFWGVLIPVQGTSIFAIFYLKKRYSFHMTRSVAMILFLYLFNVVFGGLAGLVYLLYAETFSATLLVLSLGGFFSPLFLYLFNLLLLKYGNKLPVSERIRDTIVSFFQSFDLLFKNIKNITVLLLLHVLHQISRTLAFVVLADRLDPNAGFLWGYLVTVSQEVSLILRFTPGNLGTAQAVSGFVSHLTDVPVAIGLIVAVIESLLMLVQVFVFGGIGNFMVLKGEAGGISGFWSRARHTALETCGDDDSGPGRSGT